MQLSSKKLADEFKLHHRSVLRSIRRLQNIEALKEQFKETSFEHKGGTYPAYLVSEVGFAILMHRFKVDDFKRVNYYLQRYAEERIKKSDEEMKKYLRVYVEKENLKKEVDFFKNQRNELL